MRVVGMISGTSLDAIDVAVADLRRDEADETTVSLEPIGDVSVDYPPALRRDVEKLLPPAATTAAAVCQLDTRLGRAFADAATTAINALGGDLIVSHGQTVYHWVEDNRALGTLQLGQPAFIAEATGLPVVADLRVRDIAAGGHGAPLVSLFDTLLLADRPGTPAALNLGGIANLTICRQQGASDAESAPIAFDVGPANALLDAFLTDVTGGAEVYDRGGARASAGTVIKPLLDGLLNDPYYALAAPKSTGKELFHLGYLREHLGQLDEEPHVNDVVATLTELTARTVADAAGHHGVDWLVAAGGGANNPALLGRLTAHLDDVPVTTIDSLGVPIDAKEAYAFALLGWLTIHGQAGTVAACTGAAHPSILGAVLPGRRGLPMVDGLPKRPSRLRIAGGAHA